MLYHFGKRLVFIRLVLTGACLSSCLICVRTTQLRHRQYQTGSQKRY